MKAGAGVPLNPGTLQIIAGLSGRLEIQSDSASVKLSAGQFCLVPACLERTEITAKSDAAWLLIEAN
jgi:mannose-6-phosphate isomerase class I